LLLGFWSRLYLEASKASPENKVATEKAIVAVLRTFTILIKQKLFPPRFSWFFSRQIEAVFKKRWLPTFTQHTKPYCSESAHFRQRFQKDAGALIIS